MFYLVGVITFWPDIAFFDISPYMRCTTTIVGQDFETYFTNNVIVAGVFFFASFALLWILYLFGTRVLGAKYDTFKNHQVLPAVIIVFLMVTGVLTGLAINFAIEPTIYGGGTNKECVYRTGKQHTIHRNFRKEIGEFLGTDRIFNIDLNAGYYQKYDIRNH